MHVSFETCTKIRTLCMVRNSSLPNRDETTSKYCNTEYLPGNTTIKRLQAQRIQVLLSISVRWANLSFFRLKNWRNVKEAHAHPTAEAPYYAKYTRISYRGLRIYQYVISFRIYAISRYLISTSAGECHFTRLAPQFYLIFERNLWCSIHSWQVRMRKLW